MSGRASDLDVELARVRAERDTLARELEIARPLAKLIEGVPVAIMRVSGTTGRYIFFNETFAKLIGQSREEILACDPYDVWIKATHPDDLAVERSARERLAKGEIDRYRLDKRILSAQGEAGWFRVEAVGERDDEGRLLHVTAFFIDIHQERAAILAKDELEAQLRREQRVGALGKLAGGVAHDFNNRLVIIMGHTELIKRGLPQSDPLSHHADTVLSNAKRAADLTRQLLAYSRRQVLKPEAFDPNEMVERMHRLLKSVMADQIELVIALKARGIVFAEPGQIEQVILNLTLNARDAMPNGGTLTLETKDVTLGPREDPALAAGNYVALIVTDTGTGISDDILPHIFEPFFTTKDIGRGTGLGLSTVEGVVRQSGGVVRVESRTRRGTTFTILLPQAQSIPTAPRYTTEDDVPSRRNFETVLVCDDDDEVRELLAGVLGLRAYTILKAKNGREAIEVARAHPGPIHLLLTDIAMPGLGGVELAAELRARDPKLRVLYMSGHAEDADMLSRDLGPGTHFLAKPFLPGELTRLASSILEGQDSTSAMPQAEIPGNTSPILEKS